MSVSCTNAFHHIEVLVMASSILLPVCMNVASCTDFHLV